MRKKNFYLLAALLVLMGCRQQSREAPQRCEAPRQPHRDQGVSPDVTELNPYPQDYEHKEIIVGYLFIPVGIFYFLPT